MRACKVCSICRTVKHLTGRYFLKSGLTKLEEKILEPYVWQIIAKQQTGIYGCGSHIGALSQQIKNMVLLNRTSLQPVGELKHGPCNAHPPLKKEWPHAASIKVNLVNLEGAGTKGKMAYIWAFDDPVPEYPAYLKDHP